MAVYRTWSVLPVVPVPVSRDQAKGSFRKSEPKVEQGDRTIPVRVRETEQAWMVEADVPGVPADAIGVEFFQDRLTVRFARPVPGDSPAQFDDRAYGNFERVIRIGDDVRADGIVAKVELGVLRLEVPRSGAHQPRTIPVVQG